MAAIETLSPNAQIAQRVIEESGRLGIPIQHAVWTSYPDDQWRLLISLGEASASIYEMSQLKLSAHIHHLSLKDPAFFDLRWRLVSPKHPVITALEGYHGIEPSNPKHISVVFDGATFLEDPVILKAA